MVRFTPFSVFCALLRTFPRIPEVRRGKIWPRVRNWKIKFLVLSEARNLRFFLGGGKRRGTFSGFFKISGKYVWLMGPDYTSKWGQTRFAARAHRLSSFFGGARRGIFFTPLGESRLANPAELGSAKGQIASVGETEEARGLFFRLLGSSAWV